MNLPYHRCCCSGSSPEATLLRIERPSIATARHYYNDKRHNNHLLRKGRGGLEVISSKAPKRHSTAVQQASSDQPSPVEISSSISAYGLDGVRRTSVTPEEMAVGGLLVLLHFVCKLLTPFKGKKKPYGFLCPSSAPPPVSYSPSTSTAQAVSRPPVDSLYLPITTLPLNPTEDSNICNPLHPLYLGNIPWDYTLHRLQEWGLVYLYNTATADAFVRAVPLNLRLRNSGLGGQGTPPDSRRASGSEPTMVMSTSGVGESKGKSEKQSGDTVHQPDKIVKCISSTLGSTSLGGDRGVKDGLGGSNRVQHPSGQQGSSVSPILDPRYSQPPSCSVPIYMRKVEVRVRVIPPTTGASIAPRQPIVIEKSFPVNVNQFLDHFGFLEQHPPSSPPSSPPPSPLLATVRHHEVPALPIRK